MALIPFDDASTSFNDLLSSFDGAVLAGCVSFDDAGTMFDAAFPFDCGAVGTTTTTEVAGASGKWDITDRDRRAMAQSQDARSRLLREDDELMVLL